MFGGNVFEQAEGGSPGPPGAVGPIGPVGPSGKAVLAATITGVAVEGNMATVDIPSLSLEGVNAHNPLGRYVGFGEAAVSQDEAEEWWIVAGQLESQPETVTNMTINQFLHVYNQATFSGGVVYSPASPSEYKGVVNNLNVSQGWMRVKCKLGTTLTGLSSSTNGREIKITNVGTNPLTLVYNSLLSFAANRFLFSTGLNWELKPGQTLKLIYDEASKCWRDA